ncbi:MAG: tyrosine--tRNA ligase, partial [Acetobacteraceae bacterium]
MPRSSFLREAAARGFVFQTTDVDRLDAALLAGPVSAYIGFDCTADSLHVGSLVQIMILRLLQRHGHRPVVLMGGGTTRIGDPSGKDEARQLLTDEQIGANMAGIRRCFEPFLRFGDGPADAVMADNAEWLNALGYIPLLREVGVHFTINRMLSFDSVRLRLEREQPLTFLEFNYMILQSYDFRELARRLDVSLQIGGSDQWGNIIAGVELARRTDGRALHGLTTPLITTAAGAKMGKSARGAVWLTADRLSPYEYWQFWRNTDDADLGRFLRLFTDLALAEITRLEAGDVNEAKKVLATEATRLCHGTEAAKTAAETARRAFEEGEAADTLPSVDLPRADLASGIPAFRLFA